MCAELNAWLQQREPRKVDDVDLGRDILWQGCLALNALSILLAPLTGACSKDSTSFGFV
jgi:hypothetical protein